MIIYLTSSTCLLSPHIWSPLDKLLGAEYNHYGSVWWYILYSTSKSQGNMLFLVSCLLVTVQLLSLITFHCDPVSSQAVGEPLVPCPQLTADHDLSHPR